MFMKMIKRLTAAIAAVAMLMVCALAAQYYTSIVELDDFSIGISSSGSIARLGYQALSTPVRGAKLNEVYFSAGDAVSAGDVICTYTVIVSGAEATRARGELASARDDYEYEIARRDVEIADMRARLSTAEGLDARELELRIERAQMTYEKYSETALVKLAALEAASAAADAASLPRELRAGMDGVLLSVIAPGDESTLNPGRAVAEIYDPARVLVRVPNAAGNFKYGMVVNVRVASGSGQVNIPGEVVAADNVLPGALRTGSAYIALERLPSGNVSQITATATAISISNALVARANTLTYSGGLYSVRILTPDGAVRTRRVIKAFENESEAWLLKGVSEADKLIIK